MEPSEKSTNTAIVDQVKKFIGDRKVYKQGESQNELVIRTGEAEEIKYKKAVEITGVINSPAKFFEKRKELHNNDECHLLFDKQKGIITLVVNEQNADSGYKITGKLTPNPDLNEAFKLKVDGRSSGKSAIRDLMDALKFNKYFFVDKEVNAKIVTSLMLFKGKVQTEIESLNNERGDKRELKASKLEHELVEYFMVSMPIYRGMSAQQFRVDVRCEVASSGDVIVWLESTELGELNKTALETVIAAELKVFDSIVCIEQ